MKSWKFAGLYYGALLTLGSTLFTGCAAQSTPPPTLEQRLARMGYEKGADVESIRRYTVDGWHSVDSTHLVLDSGPSRPYLITLMFPCSGLDFVENLRFTTTPPGDLTRLDQIIVPQPGGPQHCPIKTIAVLSKLDNQTGK